MKLEPIDNRLYKVSEVLPADLAYELSALQWDEFPYTTDDRMPLRKAIDAYGKDPILTQAEDCIINLEKHIEDICKITYNREECINTSWWYDLPGFSVGLHTDGHLPCTLQLFWVAAGEEFGTKFYNSKRPHDLKYNFPFIPNTGYLMLNGLNLDGSQPLQWHGMLNKVPANTYRVTSYTRFGTYTDK